MDYISRGRDTFVANMVTSAQREINFSKHSFEHNAFGSRNRPAGPTDGEAHRQLVTNQSQFINLLPALTALKALRKTLFRVNVQ